MPLGPATAKALFVAIGAVFRVFVYTLLFFSIEYWLGSFIK